MNRGLHIMFAGGGTGGHLFPGLAVAEELTRRAPGARIAFGGTGGEWERTQVARAGYEYHRMMAAPLAASPWAVIRSLYSNGFGYRTACRGLRDRQPDLIVGLGGYSSVPLALAAVRLGIPLLVLEQNVIPGRANQLLARWASTVCLAFDAAARCLPSSTHVVCTGNPVRRAIVERLLSRVSTSPPGFVSPTLIILGGSQGASSLNRAVVEALPRTASFLREWSIIHQTGNPDARWVREAYRAAEITAEVAPFIEDMGELYSRVSLAICRAGATTLAELAVVGIPGILVPYPQATADHQWHNAQAFGRAGAAVVVEEGPEPGRSAASLSTALLGLLKFPELRTEMGLAAEKLGRPAAAASVVSEILSLVELGRDSRQSA